MYKVDRIKHLLCFKLGKYCLPSFPKRKSFCQPSHI